jgi:hypothetical protein
MRAKKVMILSLVFAPCLMYHTCIGAFPHRKLVPADSCATSETPSRRTSLSKVPSFIPDLLGLVPVTNNLNDKFRAEAMKPIDNSDQTQSEIIYLAEPGSPEGARSRFRSLSSEISIESHSSKKVDKNPEQSDGGTKENSILRPSSPTGKTAPRPPSTVRSHASAASTMRRFRVGFTRTSPQAKVQKTAEQPMQQQKSVKYSNFPVDAPADAETKRRGSTIHIATQQTIDVAKSGQKAFMVCFFILFCLFSY